MLKKIFPFKELTRFELILWICSMIVVACSYLIPESKDYLTLCASLIGVTAIIFVAKGFVIGQVLIVIFAVFYGIISFYFRYYGEMITYLGMSAPIAVLSIISWMKHQYKDTARVKISSITKLQIVVLAVLAVIVTCIFYFILKAFNTANLLVSTFSVTTSFVAASLTFMRNPYYAVAYAANDIVLIVLWVLAAINDLSYLPMIMCFVMFFVNDLYGFVNWQRMKKQQSGN